MNRFSIVSLALTLPLLAGCSTSPLNKAIRGRDMTEVKRLVESGADVNKVDGARTMFAPLPQAVIYSTPEIVVYLLKKGAGYHREALDRAGWLPRPEMIEVLLDNGVNPDLAAGRYEIIDSAIRRRAARAARPAPGNLDDAAYDRMRAAASLPPENRAPVSDVDAPASRAAPRPDDFALVIGIEKYSRLPEARFAENDADAMKKHLLALGYPERNIVLLKGGQATRGAISGYVEEWLPKNTKPASRVFVYFSGHGSPDAKSGDAYLVPWDGDAMFLKSTAYPLKSLYASLGKLKAKRVLVALDSCFSGAGGRSVLAEGARPLVTRTDEVAAPAGVTVLSAASGDEITATIKEQGHGAFTYYLLKAFNNGKLTAKAAYDELKPNVQDEAHRQNREQTPLLLGDDAAF